MRCRELSPAELQQRRVAALKSGAFSEAKMAPLSRTIYVRLRRRVSRASGPTHPVQRLRLELLARILARIQLADEWFARQPTGGRPAFRRSGAKRRGLSVATGGDFHMATAIVPRAVRSQAADPIARLIPPEL